MFLAASRGQGYTLYHWLQSTTAPRANEMGPLFIQGMRGILPRLASARDGMVRRALASTSRDAAVCSVGAWPEKLTCSAGHEKLAGRAPELT